MKILKHYTNKFGYREILLDDDIYEFIIKNNISVTFRGKDKDKSPYVAIRIKGKKYPIHRFIMGFPEGIIDHLDKNPLNNRRNNLRITDKSGNAKNINCPKTNKSTGILGISKRDSRYVASFRTNGKRYTKSFNINKYGDDIALRKAVLWRKTESTKYGFIPNDVHNDILHNFKNTYKIKIKKKVNPININNIYKRRNRIEVIYYIDGKRKSKSFGVKKFGTITKALDEAINFKNSL